MQQYKVLHIILVALIGLSYALIPDYIHICQATDPNISACINNSVNHLRSRLKDGIPELNVPPLEPLYLKEIKLRSSIQANITNVKVWGPASFVVTDLKTDLRKNKFHFKIWLPHLYFKGNYELDMRILSINVHGKGPIEGNFTDYRSEVIMKGRKIKKDGNVYLKFDKMNLRLDIGKAQIRMEDLFGNDPLLKDATNEIVSENSEIFVNEIKPVLEKNLADKFSDIADKITSRFTYNELFP